MAGGGDYGVLWESGRRASRGIMLLGQVFELRRQVLTI